MSFLVWYQNLQKFENKLKKIGLGFFKIVDSSVAEVVCWNTQVSPITHSKMKNSQGSDKAL